MDPMEEDSPVHSAKCQAVSASPTDSRQAIPIQLSRDQASRPEIHGQSSQDVNSSMSSSNTLPMSSATESNQSFSTMASSFGGPETQRSQQASRTGSQMSSFDATTYSLPFRSKLPYRRPTQPVFPWIMNRQDILFEVCSWLSAKDLVNLYAVSKRFHMLMNRQMTTLLVGNAKARVPESATAFHFKAYKSLCMLDAVGNKSNDKKFMVRDVPTIRWLKFLEYREGIVKSIIVQLARKGLRLPRCASMVIKKVWFLMDIPDSKRRIGCIHNPRLWSDADLYVACMFFMKLDMACTDPILGQGERRMRAMLLAQRSLTVMDRVLKREIMHNQYDMLRMFMEWGMSRATLLHDIAHLDHVPMLTFGIKTSDIGCLSGENWKANAPYLVRPDEIVQKESIRRGLRFQDKLIDMMLWGSVHPVTGLDVFPTNRKGVVQTKFADDVEKKVEQDIAVYASKNGLSRVGVQDVEES